MKAIHILPVGLLLAGILCACDGVNPATATTPTTTVGLLFGEHPLYDDLPDRNDPCVWFDSEMNKAAQVNVEIFVPVFDEDGRVKNVIQIGKTQRFVNGHDFQNGDPDGINAKVPESGGYQMVVTVYGEIDEDCCPGPPTTRTSGLPHDLAVPRGPQGTQTEAVA